MYYNYKNVRLEKFPNSVGIVPESWLPSIALFFFFFQRWMIFQKKRKKRKKRKKSQKINMIYICCNLFKFPSWVGIVPDKGLLPIDLFYLFNQILWNKIMNKRMERDLQCN